MTSRLAGQRCLRSRRHVLSPAVARRRYSVPPVVTPPETILAPFDAFIALPAHVSALTGHPVSYAACIGLLALSIRGFVSLPITVWSRRRQDRLQEVVQPALEKAIEEASATLAARSKMSPSAASRAQKHYTLQVAQKRRQLMREHRCGPFTTFFTQVLVQGSFFIAASNTLRYAIRWPDAATQHAEPTNVSDEVLSETLRQDDRLAGMSDDIAASLTDLVGTSTAISREAWAWCPSLAAPDPHGVLPLAIGLVAFCCVEIASASQAHLRAALNASRPGQKASTVATMASSVLTNISRALSILFIAVALNSPTGVGLYWLMSFSMTLAQTVYFGRLDRLKARRLLQTVAGVARPPSDRQAVVGRPSR